MTDTPMIAPPQALKVFRQRTGFTIRQAAQAVGSNERSWAYWEGGEREAPRWLSMAMAAVLWHLPPYLGEQG